MTYPEIYPSNMISGTLNALPDLPSKPQPPVAPTRPTDPGEYESGGNRGCFMFMIIGAIILFCTVVSSENENKGYLIILSIILFFLSFFLFKTTSWDKNNHDDKKKQYKIDIAAFPSKQKKFEAELARYNTELSSFETTVENLTNNRSLKFFRAAKIKHLLSNPNRVILQKISPDDMVKKGASEDFFVDVLMKNGLNVITEYKLPVGNIFYYPDIIIEKNGLYIDVEIDEPYAGNDGTPIHYLKNRNYSIDRERNDYFNRKGIEVIRFSEEQIFRQPEICVQVILDYIESTLRGEKYELPHYDHFFIEKWSRDESMKMAYRRFRKTYIPYEYQQNIDKEEQRSYEDIMAEIRNNKIEWGDNFDGLPF